MSFTRQHLNMDPDWRFHLGDTVNSNGKSHAAVYNAAKAGKQSGPASACAYDDSAWARVDLPHDYQREAQFSPDAVGNHGYRVFENGWYRKTFSVNPAWKGKHALLVFDGISTSAQIYLNGSLIERSFSIYSEIAIDVTQRLYFDRVNTLAVYTKGDDMEGWWYEGSGIYRHVHLYIKDTLHIAHNGLWAKPVLCEGSQNDWRVELETTLENSEYHTDAGRVRACLYDGDALISEAVSEETVCPADDKAASHTVLSVKNPERWDVDAPKLYTLKVELIRGEEVIDTDSVRIGFRTVRVDAARGFFLNERPLKIKGTCNHQDHAGVGVAVPDSIQYYRIRRLKKMGSNAYRCAHNPPAREILDACDEYGMLVMDENRIFETRPDVLRNLETLIRRDRNHPSVVFYSLFNEEPLQSTAEGLAIYKKLRSCAEKLDDSRLYLGAINDLIQPSGAGMAMDVYGLNYGIPRIEAVHEQYPDHPMIGTENSSAVTTRGCYVSDRENAHVLHNYDEEVVPWGQTVRQTWKYVYERDYMLGAFDWTGFDYRGEPTPFVWPSCSSQFGILDTCGFPKDSYYFHQAIFLDEPMMHILPHWNWKEGDQVRVMTVTNCDESELFLNGVSLGRKPSDRFIQCEWQVPFAAGTISAVGYRNGEPVAKAEHRTAGVPVRIRLEADRTTIENGGQDTVPVRVSVLDQEGIEVPTASDLIRFEVEGDGFVAGVGNGDPNSHEPDHLPYRKLYCGLCQVLVTAKRGARTVKLIARGEGLEEASVAFTVCDVPAPNYVFYRENQFLTGILVSQDDAEEKPDPCRIYGDDDMNSFTPVTLETNLWNGLYPARFKKGWREFRIPIALPEVIPEGRIPVLEIASVVGEVVEFYVNGRLIHKETPEFRAPVSVPLDSIDRREFEVRALIKARTDSIRSGGISQGIFLVFSER